MSSRTPGPLYEMLARVKPIIGPKTPVTVPQIWIDGTYVGGADALKEVLGTIRKSYRIQTAASVRFHPA